jgi:3-deoxy-D-manno-octulosonic-acid transferase
VLAASTREGEEAPLLAAWRTVAAPRPRLLLVPRHPQRFDEVAALVQRAGLSMARRSAWQAVEATPAAGSPAGAASSLDLPAMRLVTAGAARSAGVPGAATAAGTAGASAAASAGGVSLAARDPRDRARLPTDRTDPTDPTDHAEHAEHAHQGDRGDGPDDAALEADVWLGDTLGEMPAYYAAARVALLGGSFAPLGGQNLIEAAACGCPVVMGPHTFNFDEAARQAEAAGAAERVADLAAGVARAVALAQDDAMRAGRAEAARAFAEAHRGAASRMAAVLLDAMG